MFVVYIIKYVSFKAILSNNLLILHKLLLKIRVYSKKYKFILLLILKILIL